MTGGVVGKAQLFCAGDDNGQGFQQSLGVAVPQDEVGGADRERCRSDERPSTS